MTVLKTAQRRRGGVRRDEAGSITVFAIIMIAVLGAVAVGVSIVGGLVISQRRTAAAADLAALAGASAMQNDADGCASARQVARWNGAAVRSCEIRGDVVTLWVEREVHAGFGHTITVSAQARAGPS